MTVERVESDASSSTPQTPQIPDNDLAAAVDEAVLGDVLDGLPEARPERTLGSPSDFSGLYVRHRSGLAAHARRFLRDPRDVDEVVQETFLRLFLAISEIETELQAIAFARRTLTNLCIDRYRADRRRPRLVDLDSAPAAELNDGLEEDDPVLRAEDAAIVREALSQLSPLHRAALIKREIEEKPLPQIAAELEIPEESVKHLLFRARRALRRLLVGTSVEPGVDLSPAEVIELANRRLARGVMQGANLMIVFVVVSVMAVVGIRPLFDRSPNVLAPVGSGDQATTGSGVAPAVGGTTRRTKQHGGRAGHRALRHTSAPKTSTPVILPSRPVHHAPTKPQKSPTKTATPIRAHLKLSGPLEVTGEPQLVSSAASAGPDGASTASSSFTAPTDQGTFELDQSLTALTGAAPSVSVTPAFVVGNAVERPTMTGSSASIGTDADGNVTINVAATAQPDLSTNAFPLSELTASIVLTPDLSQVVSESVVLAAQSAEEAPPSSANGPPASPAPPAAAGSTDPARTASRGAMPDVVENLRYVS